VAASFGLRNGFPDWTLLRMGDTFTGQAFETNYNAGAGGSDNFQWNGYSEQEPMVLSAYDEAVPVTTPDVGSGARARPIILVPSATSAYAAMQGAGNMHLFEGRDGIRMQGGGTNVAIIGLDFYSAQRNPNGAYVGSSNVFSNSSIITPGGVSGLLIEDTHTRWTSAGISINNSSPNFDVNIRRSQMDHCYGNRGLGTNDDDISPAGGVGGLMSPGFSFEENVLDLCGYSDATFTSGDSRSRNAYIQWNAVFGNRRGNTSTRSGSENFQFRSGGVVDNNFTYHGSYGFDVGHQEGDPTLASNTVVTNNVVMTPANPIGLPQIGINFSNTNNITASNNLVANEDGSLNPFVYVQTDSYDGGTNNLTISNAGTGGTPGTYGCVGGTGWFTGGSGTATGTYNFTIGVSGSLTGYGLQEPVTDTFTAGDVLTPVANSPSLSYTGGTTLTAAGSGGTPGAYGFGGSLCAINPTNPGIGGATGIVLTNFSGSMAGTGARALFDINGSGIVDAYNIIGAGHGYQVGDVLTASFGGITGVRIRVDAVGNLSGWQIIVQSVISQGTHGLTWTGNTVFNWPGSGPPSTGDNGGTHDSPLPGGAGSGTANTWTGNANCTAAQFTGAISGGTTLATSSLLQGTIANGQNLAGVGVAANTSIVSGGPTSWTITPSQSNVSAETMYSYTCTPTTVFPHPELTVDTYAALLGLSPASIDGYMTAALNNAKWNWNPALTANNGINPYIRHGFGMTP
jgi:hypothetical protein